MRIKTGKHNTISLVAKTESDYLLLSILSKMKVDKGSITYQGSRITELCLRFRDVKKYLLKSKKIGTTLKKKDRVPR